MQYEPGEAKEAEMETLRGHGGDDGGESCAVLVGPDKLKAMNKRVGDRIKVYSMGIADIVFEVEIIGEMPGDRMASRRA